MSGYSCYFQSHMSVDSTLFQLLQLPTPVTYSSYMSGNSSYPLSHLSVDTKLVNMPSCDIWPFSHLANISVSGHIWPHLATTCQTDQKVIIIVFELGFERLVMLVTSGPLW